MNLRRRWLVQCYGMVFRYASCHTVDGEDCVRFGPGGPWPFFPVLEWGIQECEHHPHGETHSATRAASHKQGTRGEAPRASSLGQAGLQALVRPRIAIPPAPPLVPPGATDMPQSQLPLYKKLLRRQETAPKSRGGKPKKRQMIPRTPSGTQEKKIRKAYPRVSRNQG